MLNRFKALFLIASILSCPAWAGTPVTLRIKDHKLIPNKLVFPKGERIELIVINEGPGTEEIESNTLRIEKIIPEGKSVTLKVGPYKPGTYEIFGEFNMATCTGTVVVE